VRFLVEVPPLTATLGRCEVEFTAALILFGLHTLGRPWAAPITAKELGKVIRDSLAAGTEPIKSWARNPFLRTEFGELVSRGFALREKTPDGDVLTLTPAALERVAGHLRAIPERE
jgi:hypothetical protein